MAFEPRCKVCTSRVRDTLEKCLLDDQSFQRAAAFAKELGESISYKALERHWKRHMGVESGKHFVPPKNFHREKIPWLLYYLERFQAAYDRLIIVGCQHVDEVLEQAIRLNKRVTIVEPDQRAVAGFPSRFEYLRGCVEEPTVLLSLAINGGLKRAAVYVNLHGNFPVISGFAKHTALTLAVVTRRRSRGLPSCLEKVRELGAAAHWVGGTTFIAVLGGGNIGNTG